MSRTAATTTTSARSYPLLTQDIHEHLARKNKHFLPGLLEFSCLHNAALPKGTGVPEADISLLSQAVAREYAAPNRDARAPLLADIATIEFAEPQGAGPQTPNLARAPNQSPGYLTPVSYGRATAGISKKVAPQRPLQSRELALCNRKSDWRALLDAELVYLKSLPDPLDASVAEAQQLEKLAQTHEDMDPGRVRASANGLLQHYARREPVPLDSSRMFAFRRQFQMFTKNMEAKKLSFGLKHAFSQQYLLAEDRAQLKFQLHTVNARRGSVQTPAKAPQPPQSQRRASPEPAAGGRTGEPRASEQAPGSARFFETRFTFFQPPSPQSRGTAQRSAKKSEYLIKTEASTLVDFSARPFETQRSYERVSRLLFQRSASNQLLEHSEDARTLAAPAVQRVGPARPFAKKSRSQTSLQQVSRQPPKGAGWLLVTKLADQPPQPAAESRGPGRQGRQWGVN